MNIIYGINSVLETLRASDRSVERIILNKDSKNPRLREIVAVAKRLRIPVNYEAKEIITRKANSPDHQGAVAVVSAIRYTTYQQILDQAASKPMLLILDGITDPRNLGAIIRTAEAAGVNGIFIPERRAAGVTQTVVTTSAGATAHMKLARVTNIPSLIEDLKKDGFWIIGMESRAPSLWTEIDYNESIAIVLGEEGKGIHKLVKERCDFLVSIPMFGKVASLNVSVAAGIILYEAIKQRNLKNSRLNQGS